VLAPPASPPRPVFHRALPSPTPQNTPQGTGANGIALEKKEEERGYQKKGGQESKEVRDK